MSFFNEKTNPFMKLFQQLSPEAQEEYSKKGEELYNFIDFETGQIIEKLPTAPDSIEAIQRLLQSGLSIDDLTPTERELLAQYQHDKKNN